MKRINANQMNVDTLYSQLNELVEIKSVGGRSLEMWHYVNANTYYPDRPRTPLLLRPTITVTDPDTGMVYTPAITSSLWKYRLENSESWTQITNTSPGADKPFTIYSNHDLEVRATFTAELLCELIYADPRNLKSVSTSVYATIVTNVDADSVYNVHITTGASGYEYSPLTDDSSLKTFIASAVLGVHDMTDEVVFQWYTVRDGSETLIGSDDPAYVSGQGTRTLVLDALYADSYPVILRMKPSASAELEPCRDQLHMLWRISPTSCSVMSPQGDSVREHTSGVMEFRPVLHTNKGLVSDAKIREHLIVKWSRRNSAGAFAAVGMGPSISQPAANMRTDGSTSTLMQAEVFLRGPYCRVIQDALVTETWNVVITVSGVKYNVVQTVGAVTYQVVQNVQVSRPHTVVQDGMKVVERQ